MTANHIQSPPSTIPAAKPPPPAQNASSPPSKRDLTSWWGNFKKKTRREEEKQITGIFHVPLSTSIKYANVAISLTNEAGETYIYGYVPIIIAKCGVFLKEKGTDVHGIFRLAGAAKRIKELQAIFDSPDRYGKGLDWTGYTVHDAASIFRRYINSLPEPVIPLSFYEQYRAPIRNHQKEATGDPELPPDPCSANSADKFDHSSVIIAYQKLITELPPLNRQLLLYLLDLLAVFASKQEVNGMDSFNLSAVFQPGILSHPDHDLFPHEYKLSQNVLVYLILNQDHFLVGMSGTEADEKTVKDVQSGAQRQPHTPTKATHAGLGRSASNASGGADSLRKAEAMRRNASVSSKNSNLSGNLASGSPAPSSPLASTASSGGVHRSNTVPSKRSPGLNSPRLGRGGGTETSTTATGGLSPGTGPPPVVRATSSHTQPINALPELSSPLAISSIPPAQEQTPDPSADPSASPVYGQRIPSNEQLRLRTPEQGVTTTVSSATPTKDRKSIFSKSPSSENERKDQRQRNRLQKKLRPSEPANISAQSSSHSLPGASESTEQQGRVLNTAPGITESASNEQGATVVPTLLNTEASPSVEAPPRLGELDKVSSFHVSQHGSSHPPSPAVRPAKSPAPSTHSGLVTEDSEAEQAGNGSSEKGQKRRSRWRLSTSLKKDQEPSKEVHTTSRLGSSAVAEESPTSMGSRESKPRKSATYDSHHTATGTESSGPTAIPVSSSDSTPSKEKDHDGDDKERRGLFGRIKAKVTQSKEDKKEREAEKEGAKSPARKPSEHAASKQSLAAIASETPTGGPTTETKGEEVLPKVVEQQ